VATFLLELFGWIIAIGLVMCLFGLILGLPFFIAKKVSQMDSGKGKSKEKPKSKPKKKKKGKTKKKDTNPQEGGDENSNEEDGTS
jgi:hypothetical protein